MTASIGFDIYAKDRASGTFNRVGNSADRAGHKLAAMGRMARVAGAAVAVGAGAAALAGYKLAKSAADDQKAAAKLSVALKNNAKATDEQVASTERWISAQGVALGVYDDDLRPALARLVTATHDVGKAQRLASLAMNVSAGTGKSLEAVSTALMKAQNGQVAGLARLGVQTKDAAGKTMAFDQIQKNLAKTFRGQAATAADTTAGRFGRLKLQLSEAGETIGYKLLPYANRFAGWVLSTGIPAVERLGRSFQTNVVPSLQRFGAYLQANVFPALQAFGSWFRDKIAPAIAAFYSTRLTKLMEGFRSLQGTIRGNGPELRKLGEWLKHAAEVSAKYLGPALQVLSNVQLKEFFGALRLGVAAMGVWVRYAQFVGKSIRSIGAASNAMRRATADALGKVGAMFKALPGNIASWVGDLGDLLVGAGQAVVQGLIDGITSPSALGGLKSALKSITHIIPQHKGPPNKDKVLLKPAGIAIMQGLIDGLKNGQHPLEKLLDKVTANVKAKGDKLKGLVQARNGFASGFQFGESIFATPNTEKTTMDAFGNETTTSLPPTVASMLAFAQQQRAQAAQVNADVKRLVGLGLSKSLIQQLQSQGSSGLAQLHALAGGSRAQIAAFNSLDKQTSGYYSAAGMSAANAVYGADIKAAARDERLVKALARELRKGLKDSVRQHMEQYEFVIKGDTLVASLKAKKRKQGGAPLGIA